MKALDFKFNEVLSFFEHAKSLGMNPTLSIKHSVGQKYEFVWLTVTIRDCRMTSRIYDKKWLLSRIKHYINSSSPFGAVRITKVR